MISKIYGNRKFWRFGVVLKLKFEVKNWYIHTKQLPIVGSGNCLVVFHNLFSPFQSLFKLPKLSIKFRCTVALRRLERVFCCWSACETMEDYNCKGEYLMVWANCMSPCNSIEVLHGSHVAWQEQWKYFAYERTSFPMGKGIFCSCHATWLPCKTSIVAFKKSRCWLISVPFAFVFVI